MTLLQKNRVFILFLYIFLVSSFYLLAETPRTYKVILDPGHGGVKQSPYEVYGDKFDPISGKYLEFYKDGAKYNGLAEMEIVLEIALELKKILDLTKTSKGFKKFQTYIKLFSNSRVEWIKIDSELTRTDSYKDHLFREKEDKNAKYRLYDYPDFATGKMQKGRISWINSKTPHLVVSLHINDLGSKNSHLGGMGAVLTPSYKTFELLKSISEGKASKEDFLNSPWNNWMIFQNKWSPLENAIADAWIYFHGYWTNKDGTKADLKRFEGYRQNMVTWKYSDLPGWERKIGKKGPYALKHEKFEAIGKFWEREKSLLEQKRRDGGQEGFGGDNHYASAALLRYVQY
ncbi:MAG: N-acetylmuramoyl-L-alanine amidase, partial [Leptospiraceae bacterium]|nr:N-acetylmuramoyl-L-alanine amidase [Leptospiraceae bacterium]